VSYPWKTLLSFPSRAWHLMGKSVMYVTCGTPRGGSAALVSTLSLDRISPPDRHSRALPPAWSTPAPPSGSHPAAATPSAPPRPPARGGGPRTAVEKPCPGARVAGCSPASSTRADTSRHNPTPPPIGSCFIMAAATCRSSGTPLYLRHRPDANLRAAFGQTVRLLSGRTSGITLDIDRNLYRWAATKAPHIIIES
jgi:hypothetical protein